MEPLSRRALRLAASTALSALALGAFSPAKAATWTSTATGAISLASLLGAADAGALPGSQKMTVRLGLAVQNKAALDAFIKSVSDPSSPSYAHFLTPKQFAATYGASPAQVAAVVGYLRQAGFSNVVVEPNGLLVSADGTAAVAEAAFNTKLEQVVVGGKRLFVNTAAAQVPQALGGLVTAVLGLNTVGQMKPALALPSLPQYGVSYTPAQFQTIYSANTVAPASNASIAIMAEGDLTGVIDDLRTAEQAFALPRVPVTIVQAGLPSTDVSGADEWDLDTQYSSGIAQNLKMLYVYAATSLSDSDLALEFSRFVTDDLAKAGSASLGECEIFPYLDGSMTVDDMIFAEAAAQGQTFFASSGDTGSFCPVGPAAANGVPAGAPLVSYPASSPYVVGVGGTTLLTNADGSYDTEISWYSGGGGLSLFETTPFWQAAAVPLLGTSGTRGVPDVAMDGDPESGATVYVDGAPEGVGGTSLSSPLALGVWARAVSINPKLGFAAPRMYGLYNMGGLFGDYPAGGFHDITLGANGLYAAGSGYDLNTGLGTFIVNQFTQDLNH